jgi:soluble lytic murein transglycosylase
MKVVFSPKLNLQMLDCSKPMTIASRWLACTLSVLMVLTPISADAVHGSTAQNDNSSTSSSGSATSKTANGGARKPKTSSKVSTEARRKSQGKGTASRAARAARTARIHQAFVASTELRPMAQQLATLRTAAAYSGVTKYAKLHTGDAAAAAYLALGHAYLLDKRYGDAQANLLEARKAGGELADYADFLAAEANHEVGNNQSAELLLHGFTERYPDSIFDAGAPELEASVLLELGNASGAERVLLAAPGSAGRTGYQLAQGMVAEALGRKEEAVQDFKKLLLAHPLSSDATAARAKLTSLGAESSLTVAELRGLADAYYNAGHSQEAAEQYRALAEKSGLDAATRNGFAVAEAACELKLKRLTTAQAEALEDTHDENGARRLYLLMELARNKNDLEEQQRIVTRMETEFPHSQWLAEALFSSGNMYMLRHDYAQAATYYSDLAAQFPGSKNAAAAHWRAGWLSYRQGLYAEAARMFDEQIKLYPTAIETVSALYWRGRLYESLDQKPTLAAANYRTIVRAYQHFFYAQMARQRLAALGNASPAVVPQLEQFQAPPVPALDESFPAESPHLAKARLLANAGMNEYVAQEIQADPDSSSWSSLAEAQIYASYGEPYRAMRALKRALPYAATASITSIPLSYWRILFPEVWWETIREESARNGLDPYLVASLIRQESEFDPTVISYANAYGLMQLLPSVGRSMAREEGMAHFETYQLLDPATNIRLGTRYLRQMMDKFGGVQEYALAAYNAGDSRVVDWQAAGPYHGMDEFVESIPFTQTREYVESILRNEETYRAIDAYAASGAKGDKGAAD